MYTFAEGQSMKPLSVDLRQRIVDAVTGGESRTSVARRFCVSCQTVCNILGYLEKRGTLEPEKTGSSANKKFTEASLVAMRAWLEEKNDLTLRELQERLAREFVLEVSQVSIWKQLAAMRMTWKKNKPRG